MVVSQAARLATDIKGELVSDAMIRRLCNAGEIKAEKISGRYDVDEDSVKKYFSKK